MINLGLPLEYQEKPEFFDAHNIGPDTDAKNGVIEKLLRGYQVQTVLDMTCGTGSQVFFLTKHGYQVTGADFSPRLLKIARAKAIQGNIDLTFIDGDMRILNAGTFDAVITIFNAIGHLIKEDFEKSLQNIYKNLKEGGIYVFDIFNLEAMTDTVVADFSCYNYDKVGDTQIHASQCSTIDREKGLLTSYNIYMLQKNVDTPERFNHTFALQIYTAKELRDMLSRNGFKTVGQYGMDGRDFFEKTTLNILTVAKKK